MAGREEYINIGLNYLKCIVSKAKNVLTIGKHNVQIKRK